MNSPVDTITCDVCIIGAGVAGALVAYKLSRAGVRVCVLEAGPRHDPANRYDYMRRYLKGDDPWRTNAPDRDIYSNGGGIEYPLNEYRVKAVGGSTLHWEGYANRFHETDFRLRSTYGIADDWPISYRDIEPYYCEAERELGVAGSEDNPFASFRSQPFPLPAFPPGYDDQFLIRALHRLGIESHSIPQARTSRPYGGRPACQTYSVCHTCPIRAKYSADVHVELAEATGYLSLVYDANVLQLETNGRGSIARAVYARSDGREHACAASIFVVAAHGVETPRLLLLSASNEFPDGIGNRSGAVGRYFMDHTATYRVGDVDYDLYPFRRGFYTTGSEQFYDTEKRAREAAFLLSGRAGGQTAPYVASKLVQRSGNWGNEFLDELKTELNSEFGRTFMVSSMVETLPDEANRIELDADLKDRFGRPCPKVVFSLTQYEHSTHDRADELLTDLLESMGARVKDARHMGFGGHHAGTCRMGGNPDKSVVDRNLRCHDVNNLYIAGSSVFTTLGATNPTLTIAALSLRLGDHLASLRNA